VNAPVMTGWRDLAACLGTDPEVFFPTPGHSPAAGKRMCDVCPVTTQCLEFALEHAIGYGIFGGLTEAERRPLLAARRRLARDAA
jgi:WhiB family transcriptional regulator, redox-sensing transcriptional regulator